MFVRNYMTKPVVTIQSSATISDALSLMNDSGVHRIPVLKEKKLIGLITDGNIQKASPTKATSLSMYEINYLLSKTTVADYMTKQVITIHADALLEEAVRLMRTNRISCLPVMEQDGLVGIITEDDIFDAFISLLGFMDTGTRIAIAVKEDKVGILADITAIMKDYGASITHLAVYEEDNGKLVIVRINTLESDQIVKKLEDAGYEVVSVLHNQG